MDREEWKKGEEKKRTKKGFKKKGEKVEKGGGKKEIK